MFMKHAYFITVIDFCYVYSKGDTWVIDGPGNRMKLSSRTLSKRFVFPKCRATSPLPTDSIFKVPITETILFSQKYRHLSAEIQKIHEKFVRKLSKIS